MCVWSAAQRHGGVRYTRQMAGQRMGTAEAKAIYPISCQLEKIITSARHDIDSISHRRYGIMKKTNSIFLDMEVRSEDLLQCVR